MALRNPAARAAAALAVGLAVAVAVAADDPGPIRFNFKGATFDQVIDFFSRATGLPVVREADVPQGTLDYLAPEEYTLDEALEILNIILQAKGVALRVRDDMLYLQKLSEMQREDIPVFVGRLPAELRPNEIITVVRPLENALAKPLAEKLATMVAAYGSVTAMEQQNSLVITETAGQVRRLLTIVDELDREDPEGAVEIFPVRHAKAGELLGSLTALLSQKVEKYVINNEGKQVKIEEEQMPGLAMSADDRTNAIIAKGTQSRIDKVREAIALLDVPAVGAGRSVRTFALVRLAPQDAAARLVQLYAKVPEPERPTVLALDDVGKVTLVGETARLDEAAALLAEIDGGGVEAPPSGQPQRAVAAIALQHIEPGVAADAVRSLLNGRQLNAMKMIAGPDGRSLVISGTPADIDAVTGLVPVLDQARPGDRTVRLLRLDADRPQDLVRKARELYLSQTDAGDARWTLNVGYDATSRVLTTVGTDPAQQRFAEILHMVRQSTVIELETRQLSLAHATPSRIVAPLEALCRQMLEPRDGRAYEAPRFDPVDALQLLIVSARPHQFAAIESVAATLDRPQQDMPPLRILQLRTADAQNLAQVLARQYDGRPYEERRDQPVSIAADGQTNTLIVAAAPEVFPEIQEVVGELNRADWSGAEREIRIFPLTVARAEELARTLDEMFPPPPVPRDRRGRPLYQLQEPREVIVRADAQTNSIIVDAPIERMSGFEELVAQLDRQEVPADREIRTYRMVNADLDAVAATLRRLAGDGSLGSGAGDRRVPITVSTEPVTRSVVVAGPQEIFARVEQVLDDLDARRAGPATALRFFKLDNARAETIAPMLADILARRVAQEVDDAGPDPAAAVHLTADRKTNTLILSAPPRVLPIADALIAELDHPRAAGGTVDLRIFHLAQAGAGEVADAVRTAVAAQAQADGDTTPFTVAAEPSSNSLVVTAAADRMQQVASMIESLDGAPPADRNQVRTMFLKHARAERVAPIVSQLLSREELIDVGQLPSWARVGYIQMQAQRGEPTVRVAADTRLNAVVISAPPALLDVAEQMVGQLDVDPAEVSGLAARGVRVLTLENADAAELARSLGDVFADQAAGAAPTIRVDADSNSLIVVATDQQYRIIEEVVRKIDRATIAASRQMRMIPLDPSKASADELARTLRRMLDRRGSSVQVMSLEELLERQQEERKPPESESGTGRGPPDDGEAKATERRSDEATKGSEAAAAAPISPPSLRRFVASSLLLAALALDEPPGDDAAVTIAVDPATNSLIVVGASRAVDRVAELARQLQEQIPDPPGRIHYIALPEEQDAAETQRLLATALRQVTPAGGRRGDLARRTAVIADRVNNALIVAANDFDFDTIGALIAAVSRPAPVEHPLKVIELTVAQPDEAARILRQVVIGANQARQASSMIVADNNAGILLVRAPPDVLAEIDRVLAEIDRPSTREFKVRTILLERADASAVAEALQRLFDDRAKIASTGRGRREQARRVSIIGDSNSNTVLVAASEEDFAEIQELVAHFDTPQASQTLSFRVFQLRHARATEIAQTVQSLANQIELSEEGPWWAWWANQGEQGRSRRGVVAVQSDARLNALIVTGEGDKFDVVEQLIEVLDAPTSAGEQRVVKLYPLRHADVDVVSDVLIETFAYNSRYRRWWETPDPTEARIRTDSRNKIIIVYGTNRQQEEIAEFIAGIDQQAAPGEQEFAALRVEFAQATDLAATLNRFLHDRALATGSPPPTATIVGSRSSNTLIVSAEAEQLTSIRQMLTRLDQPDVSADRTIEIVALADGDADEIARIVRQQFGRGGGTGVIVTPDQRTNSLIVNAPKPQLEQALALIERLDAPSASDETIIRTYALTGARAEEVVRILSETLQLDERGETQGITIKLKEGDQPAVEVKARIVADRRSNSVIVTATEESFPVIEQLVAGIDDVPAASPVEYRIIPLQHALAPDVYYTLQRFLRDRGDGEPQARLDYNRLENQLIVAATADQFEQIAKVIAELDQPSQKQRVTDFVALRFAQAQQVQEALSVFYGPLAMEADTPAKSNARIVADPATNSLVITADAGEWEQIRALLAKLDSADYDVSLQLRVIPLTRADAESVARAVNEAFSSEASRQRRAPDRRPQRPQEGEDRREVEYPTVLVEAEDWVRASAEPLTNSVIVSAGRENIAKIERIVAQLDVAAATQGLSVHVVKLAAAPAGRVAAAIREAYGTKAAQANQPLSIEVDAAGNSLVIACTPAMIADIRTTIDQLDALAPAAGQSIFIIELEHVTPDAARKVIETIGLDKPPRDDSASRLVSEPVTVAALAGRNAIIVVANPVDRETIVGLLKAIDSEPDLAEARLRVVLLRNAGAEALAAILRQVLSPADQQADTELARAVQEQVRRLSVQGEGTSGGDLRLDLTKPIRIVADGALNALLISSTESNVEALARIVAIFDQVPVTDAVTVRLYPLSNIAADQFARIVRELFQQGKQLGRVAGTALEGVPAGHAGRALLGEIALSVDQRTNTVIVAGPVDSVAMVSVLYQRIDTEVTPGWIEPRILPLRHADAQDLAETLQAVLVDGVADGGRPGPLQQQVARMRMARLDTNGGRVLEADVFSPMTRLVIRPESKLNALVLVGTPANLEVVTELVQMLDVESAAPGAAVRLYPLQHATAGRLATTITRLFDQQAQTGNLRDEDRVIIQADDRTNALVVTTSRRSFAVLEGLLKMLDAPVAPELGAIRRIELASASATRVAVLVQQLMDARLERLRGSEPETAELHRATIVADPRTNSLIVAAGPESFDVVRRLVFDFDRSALGEQALLRIMAVHNGNVERIAETVDAVMERRYAEMPAELRSSRTPLVLTDPRSNSLLVAGEPADLEAIEQLVAKLDEAPSNPAIRLHVIPLETTRAELLAPRIQTLMRQRQQSLGRTALPSDRVSIEPDTAGNSLIVAASEENLQVIRDLIDALARAGAGTDDDRAIEVVQLSSSRADDVVSLLDDMYVGQANRTRGADSVRVTADERLNAVLINAPPPDVLAIKQLVAQLDGARPLNVVEIKYIPLTSANALETVSLIENLLAGRGIGARRGSQQATVLKYLQEFASEMEVSAAIRESITLTPDMRTNTVIVSAPSAAVDMIERMIRDLDASSTGTQNVRIFKLANADALAMAEILTDLFNLSRRGNLYVLKPREAAAGPAAMPVAGAAEAPGAYAGLLGTDLTAVPDERQQLSITVDSRTNSLLVSGTPVYLDLVADVVKELDALEANEREAFVYPLRNAVATEVADVLSEFIDQEQQKLLSTLSPDQVGSVARLLEREITIVGDEKSNTVLVSASPRYLDRVRGMITDLDVDPPQVLIQVLVAEISLDSRLEWGTDVRFQVGPYGGDDLVVRGASSLASAFLPSLGIPTFSIATDDFTLLLKALEAQGRIQVLSNPSVMAANNQSARIQIGENIGRAESSSLAGGGTQQTTVEYIDIGVILEVTPSINPDGFVRMNINPEITDLTNRTTQVTEDLSVPVLTKRTANTTITVRDGQTIVIGGLISDMYEKRKRKVPILGDIPLLGLLFTSEFTDTQKIELLIVLTPHVIVSPADFAGVRRLTEREIGRLSISPQEKEFMHDSFVLPALEDAGMMSKDDEKDKKKKREDDRENGPENEAGGPGEGASADPPPDNGAITDLPEPP